MGLNWVSVTANLFFEQFIAREVSADFHLKLPELEV